MKNTQRTFLALILIGLLSACTGAGGSATQGGSGDDSVSDAPGSNDQQRFVDNLWQGWCPSDLKLGTPVLQAILIGFLIQRQHLITNAIDFAQTPLLLNQFQSSSCDEGSTKPLRKIMKALLLNHFFKTEELYENAN